MTTFSELGDGVPVDELVAEEWDESMQILAGAVRVGWMVVGLNRHQQPSTEQFQTKSSFKIIFFSLTVKCRATFQESQKNFVAVTKIIQDKAIIKKI
jgi:hypothetical protein